MDARGGRGSRAARSTVGGHAPIPGDVISMDGVQASAGTTFGLGGDPDVLTVAADQLRADIARGGYRTHPPGEFAMYAVARLLDSLAGSLRRGRPLRHDVVSSAMEIARHVRTYLPRLGRTDAPRGQR